MLENSEISKAKEYRDRLTNFSNEFDLGLFIHICRKSFWWVLLCIACACIGAAIYLRYTPYNYESKAVIQLAEEQQPDELLGVAAPEHNNEPEAKVELLRSKLLIGRTVNKLPLRVSYFAKGEILTAQHYLTSPYQVDILELTNVLIQDKQIQISFQSQTEFTIAYDGNTFEHCAIGKEISTPDFKILVGISDWEELNQSDQEYDLYFVFNSTNSFVSQFYDHINVRTLNSTAKTI